ncbi:MAG: hypothetical protein WAL80_21665 [Xanthobacteraceae bacterium]
MKYELKSMGSDIAVVENGYIRAIVGSGFRGAALFTKESILTAPTFAEIIAAIAKLPAHLDDINDLLELSQEDCSWIGDFNFDRWKLQFCSFDAEPDEIMAGLTDSLRDIAPVIEAAGSSTVLPAVDGNIHFLRSSMAGDRGCGRRAKRKKRIALRTRGHFRNLGFANVDPEDPYNFFSLKSKTKQREYFLKDDESFAWIWLQDLPDHVEQMLRDWITVKHKTIREIQEFEE